MKSKLQTVFIILLVAALLITFLPSIIPAPASGHAGAKADAALVKNNEKQMPELRINGEFGVKFGDLPKQEK